MSTPRSPGRPAVDRRTAVAVAVVVLAAVALVWRPWSGSGRRVVAIFDAAPGLVTGAEVQRAGVSVGRVDRISLDGDRPRVTLRLKDGQRLHRGASADLRMVSLSGQLNRVVSLTDGEGPELRDGATLGLSHTDQPVAVEQVLSTLDPRTRRAVRAMVAGATRSVSGRGQELAGTLRRARAALQAIGDTAGDVDADAAALRRVVSSTSGVATTLAASPGTTGTVVDRLAVVLSSTAAEQDALRRSLGALPTTMRIAGATLDAVRARVPRLRTAVSDVAPAVRSARAIAPELRRTLTVAVPVLADLRRTTTEGPARLRTVRPLLDEATPLLTTARTTLDQAAPMLDEARVRLPDFFSFFANWADFTSVYDANGHGARVGIVLPPAPDRTASPDGQEAGNLPRPFLRPPGSLEGTPWTDYRSSFQEAAP